MSNDLYDRLKSELRAYEGAVEATGSGDSLRWMDQAGLRKVYEDFMKQKQDVELSKEEETLVYNVRDALGYNRY
jgi:hypothetical protein